MSGILNVWDSVSQSYKPLPALVGRGIKSFTYDSSKDKWIVLYTDNTTEIVKGPTLEEGADGVSPTVELVAIDGGYRLSITDAEGTKTANILNGNTPRKGVDYFTEADKAEIAEAAAELVDIPSGSWNDLTDKPTLFSGDYNDLKNKPSIPSALSEMSDDATHRTVSDTEKNSWNAKSTFSGSYDDLTDKPASFSPAPHNQAASTITAGTFGGQVKASGQNPGTYLVRNINVGLISENPTVNGEIFLLAE